jgi:SWI/SNF-related matrix-associated actin-dependent regulator 1 of chromatin subfamily A
VPTPFDYQTEGAEHLLSGRARYLADEMGLGKTVQAILAANESGAASVAVICPAAVVPNWEAEWAIWGDQDIEFQVHSYASTAVRNRLIDADIVILDEAHYVKNRKAKRTSNALAIAARADRAFLLSGTPARNMSEMWAAFDALWPELLTDDTREYDDWLRHFCITRRVRVSPYTTIPKIVGHRKDTVADGRALLSQVMLRRTLKDVSLQLPDLRVTLHRLPRDPETEQHLKSEETELQSMVNLDVIEHETESMARLRNLLGIWKAPAIADLISEELEAGAYNKIVLGYYHKAVGDILARRLDHLGVVRLDGSTPKKTRKLVVDQFNKDPKTRVFLGQMQSAGEGLNLQADCHEIALVEPAWTPAQNRQFIKRVHRIGQNNKVRARVFAVTGTLDEAVMSNLLRNVQMEQELGL